MTINPTIGEKPILHPGTAYQHAQRLGTPQDFWGRANSYTCQRGKEPGKCWLLMLRKHVDELDKNEFHQLLWKDPNDPDRKLQIPRLAIVSTMGMNRALAGDEKAAHLVELEDVRRVLHLSSLNDQYNVRIPAPDGSGTPSGADLYYGDSLSGGTTVWTWQTLLDDLWDNLPGTIAGTAPTLPYTPDGTPEGWRFIGISAWDAIHEVLDKISCTTTYNPIADTFAYVRLGTEQDGLTESFNLLTSRLIYDYDGVRSFDLAAMPETIRVFFQRREEYHGIEKDTPNADNWEMSPVVSQDYATGFSGAETGSVLNVWDDMPALFNSAGTNVNVGLLHTRAEEIGENIANLIDVSDEPLHRHISGIETSILTGSEVSEVRWRDYGDAWGLVTEIVQRTPRQAMRSVLDEHLQPPDLARASHPVYPRTDQLVQVDDGASATGADLTANGDGLFPGFVVRYIGSYETLEDCWIRPLDLHSDDTEASIIDVCQKDRFMGRLSGSQTSGGSTFPVYLVRNGGTGAGSYDFDVTADTGGPFTIDSGDTVDFDASGAVFATESNTESLGVGIVTVALNFGTTKVVSFSVDKSVTQRVRLNSDLTGGAVDDILIRDGVANTLSFQSTSGTEPPINMAETAAGSGIIDITPRNPFHTITEEGGGDQDLDYQDKLDFDSENGVATKRWEVSKNADVVTVKQLGYPPVGTVLMHWKKPILVAGTPNKYYMDNGGVADLDWALMDGVSNAGSGLSGIAMGGTGTGANDPAFFVRAVNRRDQDGSAGSNQSYGRANETTATSHHLDYAEVTVVDHDDHAHDIVSLTCDNDSTGADTTEFQFTTGTPVTSGVVAVGGGTAPAGVLGHEVQIMNSETGADDEFLQMLPPYKTLHFYERISVGAN